MDVEHDGGDFVPGVGVNMTRRWFGKVIAAIAAAIGCGTAQALPRYDSAHAVTLSNGTVREDIAQEGIGWVDLEVPATPLRDGYAYVSAVKAKALWPLSAGTRVCVANARDAYPIGKFPLIYMAALPEGGDLETDGVSRVAVFGAKPTSTFTLSTQDGTLERGW